jgi:hypothetical protein
MAEELDDKELVSFKQMIMANSIERNPLASCSLKRDGGLKTSLS